jgi:hypothetical protein
MQKEKASMEKTISVINHALEMGRNRLQWYKVTGDNNHIKECKEWNDIASYYMNLLIKEQKNEV